MGYLGQQPPIEDYERIPGMYEASIKDLKYAAEKYGMSVSDLVLLDISIELKALVNVMRQFADHSDENLGGLGDKLDTIESRQERVEQSIDRLTDSIASR